MRGPRWTEARRGLAGVALLVLGFAVGQVTGVTATKDLPLAIEAACLVKPDTADTVGDDRRSYCLGGDCLTAE